MCVFIYMYMHTYTHTDVYVRMYQGKSALMFDCMIDMCKNILINFIVRYEYIHTVVSPNHCLSAVIKRIHI
jgi:hypothetical protein